MDFQEKFQPQTYNPLFEDKATMRRPVSGTVARGQLRDSTELYTGRRPDGEYVETVPIAVNKEVLERGQEKYNVYCTPCHGQAGYGEGMIVQRGYTQPPSLHIPRLRVVPDGHFFNVITDGFGRMPSYAAQVPVEDRWAIVAYIRALQLSQRMRVDELPSSEQMGGSVEQGETSGTGGQRGEPTER